ncbi:hypothetical protein NIES2135_48110 [Leptolyngbya boryana NIES-2135]|uniref:Uncharacterized protein n=2 Tax=Leptolyngbya group TaxID=3081713 RepID=A0A1Z4JMQ6_LEPBY|nr:hypothetical protein NIES2135_48110 [Leptolyngbya boryana NIES-2135]
MLLLTPVLKCRKICRIQGLFSRTFDMAQNSPNWFAIILGSSGLVGLVTLVTKGIVDRKDVHIQYLTQRNEDLKEEAKAEKEKAARLVIDIAQRLNNVDTGRFSPEDAVRLKEIFSLLNNFESLSKGFADCKEAAEWLETCKENWVQQASKYTLRSYSNLIPRQKIGRFKEDLTEYLNWVHTCLKKYGGRTQNTPLPVENPIVESPHPYIAAINYLIDERKWGELTPEQIAYLREVLKRLIDEIRKAFENQQLK